ncbi:D-glycero-alpha-D-manno-heptose-1,7-bisphosphate 7-phosphatase [Arthrobacter sp. zg-Y769]|uniref:D-glycero-alpha-D-manno-heptose-1,7-bisphosphate 7-phosphatase n=1 Tax=Arthrobacter sp. zg-Y769 TaxID=2894191 RepID=UPI001E377CC4|nr:HAD-IIIA family hydrolase [Arthrobacter sp. zg-Y769]MCC9205791.1 HAD-IIIA family hydrolase [Arthrobacter sp. zg-Y769]
MEFLPSPPRAVLFDRDGTLIVDVPYNADPTKVRPMPGAAEVLAGLRRSGIPVGVVTNQSGIGRGILSAEEVAKVNAAVEDLLGPFDIWEICPHAPGYGCVCRKPMPGLVLRASRRLGLDPVEVAVIGDIGADVKAAAAAGSRGVLVPTAATRPAETAAAPLVARDLAGAVDLLWGSR